MMSEKIDTILQALKEFGMTDEEAGIYLSIHAYKADTALKLSRNMKLPRTTVYRLLDNLIAKGFVLTRLGERGTRYTTLPIEDFGFILESKELELAQLKKKLPDLADLVKVVSGAEQDKQQVTYYHSVEGIKQVTYNSLKAKGELLTFEVGTMNSFMDREESEQYRRRFVENKIHIRTLTNSSYIEPWTNITEMVNKYWEIRYIAPITKPFEFEILIYNDIYAMYRYLGSEIFCVEIQSAQLAQMQKQLFEYLWNEAKRFKVLNDSGEAKVIGGRLATW